MATIQTRSAALIALLGVLCGVGLHTARTLLRKGGATVSLSNDNSAAVSGNNAGAASGNEAVPDYLYFMQDSSAVFELLGEGGCRHSSEGRLDRDVLTATRVSGTNTQSCAIRCEEDSRCTAFAVTLQTGQCFTYGNGEYTRLYKPDNVGNACYVKRDSLNWYKQTMNGCAALFLPVPNPCASINTGPGSKEIPQGKTMQISRAWSGRDYSGPWSGVSYGDTFTMEQQNRLGVNREGGEFPRGPGCTYNAEQQARRHIDQQGKCTAPAPAPQMCGGGPCLR